MMKQLFQFVLVQFKEFYRQPGVLFWSFAFPLLMAWGLGIAFSKKGEMVKNVAVVHAKESNTEFQHFIGKASEQVDKDGIHYFTRTLGDDKTGHFKYHLLLVNWNEAMLMLKRGKISMVIDNANGQLEYHFDPMNSEAYLAYLQLSDAIGDKGSLSETAQIKPLSQAGTRYIDFLIPGLMAMGLMMSAMWGVSYSLIDKRTKKLLRRMVATPMKKSSFLFSHFISRFSINILESSILFLFAWWYFDIHIEGNPLALFFIILAGNLSFVGLAIFISSRTSNTQIGNGLINLIVMPMMVGSGIFFSYHNFPDAIIPVIRNLPLTLMADGIRSIFLEGAGFKQVWSQILILSTTGIVFFGAGAKIYKWY